MDLLIFIIAAAILLIFLYIAWKITKKLIVNSIVGLVILGILYVLDPEFFKHWLEVFLITVIFGIPGILISTILKFLGINI